MTSPKRDLDPLGTPLQLGLLVLACMTVFLVGLWLDLEVNRVFDIPKAVALKTGGFILASCLAWFLLVNPKLPTAALRLLGWPMAGLLIVAGISTALSIDPATSLLGVYERQFGFQGLFACFALFVAGAVQTRRAATLGLHALIILSGLIGAYGVSQWLGLDPLGFFREPSSKVYSTLGNATFAGNALALMLPISLFTSMAELLFTSQNGQRNTTKDVCLGMALMIGLVMLPIVILWIDSSSLFLAQAVMVLLLLSLGPVLFVLHRIFRTTKMRPGLYSGALLAFSLFTLLGVYVTRTRGAWVGSLAGLFYGFFSCTKPIFPKIHHVLSGCDLGPHGSSF